MVAARVGKFVLLTICVIIMCVIPARAEDDVRVVTDDSELTGYDSVRSIGSTDSTAFHLDDVSEIFQAPDPASSEAPVRVRRQIGLVGLTIQELSVTQDCDSILVWWTRLAVPYNHKLHSVSSEFKHFNIYRSNAAFDDVHGMTPHVDGSHEPALQNTHTNQWRDFYPSTHLPMYYAVTIVYQDGSETTRVDAKKVTFVGAIKMMGGVRAIVPGALRGSVLHHSVAYNPTRNEYLVAFDLDVNYDNKPDKVYALRLDTQGNIVDRTVLDFTANIGGMVRGDQGWPKVVFNPTSNEFFAIFQFRSSRHFQGKYIILGQRILAARTERAANPQLVIKGQDSRGRMMDVIHPEIIYNPATGGFVAAMVIVEARKEVFGAFLNSLGNIQQTGSICSYKSNAYEPKLFLDERRNEILFTCTVESAGANADFRLGSAPYLIVSTKKNATGGHAAISKAETKHFVGYTNKQFARVQGYYNRFIDRVELFWENEKKQKNTISKASVMLTQTQYLKGGTQDYDCGINKEIRTPIAQLLPESGGHYMLWQEKVGSTWSIGGQFLQGGNMNMARREQRNPAMVYNAKVGGMFVVWQEVTGRNVRLMARHVTKSRAPTCQPRCQGSQRCAMENVCIERNFDPCAVKNGGCSHTCTASPSNQVTCSCPSRMGLDEERTTCQNQRQIAPLPPYAILATSQRSLWKINIDSTRKLGFFNKIPVSHGQSLVALSRDSVDDNVFWSDIDGQLISRANVDGSAEQAIVSYDVQIADGIAIDVIARMIYWTDGGLKRISRANLDGNNRQILVNGLDKPRAIVLFRRRRLIYWTDWGTVPKIERMDMNGNHRRTVVRGNLAWPNGLVLDEATSQLFWVDAKLDKIETCNYLGGRRRELLSSHPRLIHPYGVAVLKNRLFWSDWGTNSISSIDKNTGKDFETVVQNIRRPSGFVVYESSTPTVQTRCPDPGNPLGGGRNPRPDSDGKYALGTSLHHTCNPGRNLKGSRVRTCLATTKWSGEPVECTAPLIFQEIPTNTTANETESAVLKCQVSDPNIKIRWLKDGKTLPKMDGVFTLRSGHLFFLSLDLSDRGWYTCTAKNDGGEKKFSAYLNVKRPLNANCGNPTFTTRGKIVGGRRAERGAHPWQVSLQNTITKRHFCGGSLVSDRWIVTAAHCVSGMVVSNMVVRLGKYNLDIDEDFAVDINPKQIKIHPSYALNTYDSDVALIKLKKRVVFTDYIKPICLPLSNSDSRLIQPGRDGIISGWGARRLGGKSVRKLHEVKIPVVDQQTCQRSHRKYTVTANMFCGGTGTGGKSGDACQGDSGGPFSIDSPPPSRPSGHRHVLLGVISWGDGCGKIGKYGVYTRLTNAFVEWIKKEMTT